MMTVLIIAANKPYPMNITNVIIIKTRLNKIMIPVSFPAPDGMNCGRNERKNRVNFGFNKFNAAPFIATPVYRRSILSRPNSILPAEVHVFHAKYIRYATPANLITMKARALIFIIAESPNMHAVTCGIMPKVQPTAAATAYFEFFDKPVFTVYMTPVPGISTTTNAVRMKLTVIIFNFYPCKTITNKIKIIFRAALRHPSNDKLTRGATVRVPSPATPGGSGPAPRV